MNFTQLQKIIHKHKINRNFNDYGVLNESNLKSINGNSIIENNQYWGFIVQVSWPLNQFRENFNMKVKCTNNSKSNMLVSVTKREI